MIEKKEKSFVHVARQKNSGTQPPPPTVVLEREKTP